MTHTQPFKMPTTAYEDFHATDYWSISSRSNFCSKSVKLEVPRIDEQCLINLSEDSESGSKTDRGESQEEGGLPSTHAPSEQTNPSVFRDLMGKKPQQQTKTLDSSSMFLS